MDRSNTTLLVRHLPKELSNQEKIDLLCHFGAECARPMGTKGPLKHTAFAKFENEELAERGLKRLHQLELLGCKLVVEYAITDHIEQFPTGTNDEKVSKTSVKDEEAKRVKDHKRKAEVNRDDDPFLVKHRIPYPRKPTLYYRYPPPTVSTLTNIANALASHSKFYTQVLHLMNKMNMPCPFGAVTASPPLALDSKQRSMYNEQRMMNEYSTGDFGEIEEVEMEEEESELDSEDDTTLSKEKLVSMATRKRPRKRMRLVKPDMSMVMRPVHIPKPSEVFENIDERKSSQIVFNIAGTEPEVTSTNTRKDLSNITAEKTSDVVITGGFGKVEPVSKPEAPIEVQKPDVNYKLDPTAFVAVDKVASGKLKPDQMKEFSVFKNYSRGDATCRLYIKNLTKQATEQDLVNLFGNFIDWNSHNAVETFDIRLMKEGRMKGQSFVTLPDEGSAVRIVDNCNSYVLNNKPIVIQFARSARAKEVDKPVE